MHFRLFPVPLVLSLSTAEESLAHNLFKNWDIYSELQFCATEKQSLKNKLSMGTVALVLGRCRGSSLAVLPLELCHIAARMELTRKYWHCLRTQPDQHLLFDVQLIPGRLLTQHTRSAYSTFISAHKFSMLLAAEHPVQKPMAFPQKIFYLL